MDGQDVSSPGRRNAEEQTTNRPSFIGRSTIYTLVGVSFFLLCIIQLSLNVLFSHCDVFCDRSEKNSTGNFTRMSNCNLNVERYRLALEEVVKERDRLSVEKEEVVKERDRLSVEKEEVVKERDRLAAENSNLKVEKSELQNEIDKLRKELTSQGCLGTPTSRCPEGWTEYRSSCYRLSSKADTWRGAGDVCARECAHLVMLDDACEEDFVRRLGGDLDIWIGMSCNIPSSHCTLEDGHQPTYLNRNRWNFKTSDPCGCVYFAPGSWFWFFDSCSQNNYWICERRQ